MKYFEILTHHYAWSNKEFEEFSTSSCQVRHHIVSDHLEYWHLTPGFWSGNIMLLTWLITPHSKPNSSPSFGLRTKNRRATKKCYHVIRIFQPQTGINSPWSGLKKALVHGRLRSIVSLIALILCFFPSLLSSELVLLFTEPKLNAYFQRRRLRKLREWARHDSDDLLSITEWHLKCHFHYFLFRATCVIVKDSFSQNNNSAPKEKVPVWSDPIRSPIQVMLKAIKKLAYRRDVFVQLPTGFGSSVMFQPDAASRLKIYPCFGAQISRESSDRSRVSTFGNHGRPGEVAEITFVRDSEEKELQIYWNVK